MSACGGMGNSPPRGTRGKPWASFRGRRVFRKLPIQRSRDCPRGPSSKHIPRIARPGEFHDGERPTRRNAARLHSLRPFRRAFFISPFPTSPLLGCKSLALPKDPMPTEVETIPPYYIVWRRAAEIRQGWSQQTRANRRRRAKTLLRRIGLDESLLPPIVAHYHPTDPRYRPPESIYDEP